MIDDFGISENVDFEIFYLEDDPGWAYIRLLREPWNGCEVSFGQVHFGDTDDDGFISMTFEHDVINPDKFDDVNLRTNRDYIEFLGKIICYLITMNTVTPGDIED